MLTKRRSRSGISTLIGAIFFVLVVFLVFTSTVLIFENFTGFATSFKQVNAQDVQNKNTILSVQDLAFGELSTVAADESLSSVTNTNLRPYLPVQNMNFTSSMNGWTFSKGYELSLHNGTLANYPKNVLPGLDVFTMVISNVDSAATYPQGTVITSITLLVNSAWKVPGTAPNYIPQVPPSGPTSVDWQVSVAGNSITWSLKPADPCTDGIETLPPGLSDNLQFSWSAVPPPISGPYLHDITLTWEVLTGGGGCTAVRDHGTATIKTNVVPSAQGGTDFERIASEPPNTVPGGSFGGLDQVSSNIGSESGPDSVYLSFQPTFNGEPITTTLQGGVTVPEQLTAQMNYTTYFTLDSALPLASEASPINCDISHANCPVLSMGYSLDHAVSGEPPLITMNAYLVDVTTGSFLKIVNSTAINVTNNGWFMNDTAVWLSTLDSGTRANPQLSAGEYSLVVSLTETVFGVTPPSADYPPSVLMHLDDIGLAFQEAATSYCVDTAASGTQPCAPATYHTTGGAFACPAASPPIQPDSCGLFAPLVAFTGRTTSASPTIATDASVIWSPNQWLGYTLVYTSGPAMDEWSIITASGADTLTTAAFGPQTPVGGNTFEIVDSVSPSQLQSLQFDSSLSVTSPGSQVTAYAYLESVAASRTTPSWVELGQVTFTSSANLEVTIPASSAPSFLDEDGGLCNGLAAINLPTIDPLDPAGSVCIRFYAVSTTDFGTLRMNTSLVVQTFQQDQSTILVLNNSTAPVHIVSTYVSGVTSTGRAVAYGNASGLTPAIPLGASGGGIWIPGGAQASIQLGLGSNALCNTATGTSPTSLSCFSWVTGQAYLVTLTTDKGIVVSKTFVSP